MAMSFHTGQHTQALDQIRGGSLSTCTVDQLILIELIEAAELATAASCGTSSAAAPMGASVDARRAA